MEDLDIIRHPARSYASRSAARSAGRAAEPVIGHASRPRTVVGRPAKVGRGLSRSSAKVGRGLPRVRCRASKPAAGLQSIINKIITS